MYIVNSVSGKAAKSLKESGVDLDGTSIDFHFFFKHSATQSEQYSDCHKKWKSILRFDGSNYRWFLSKQWSCGKTSLSIFSRKFQPFLVLVLERGFCLGMLVSKATSRIRTFLLQFHLLPFFHRILK